MKYIEVPDLHFDDQWIDTIELVLNSVIRAARQHDVDFVVFPGDMHNKNTYVTQEYNRFRAKIRELLSVCPCAAVVGTPGHETESVYGPLEDIGLMLLRPGRVYGFGYGYSDYGGTGNKKIAPHDTLAEISGLIFGVPELTKQNVMAELACGAEQANAAVEYAFSRYIAEFIAPHRAEYPNIPAIGVMHGNVTDASARENETDVRKKSASIIISTDTLAVANLTRWSIGHPHLPWESSKICAGNAGSWGISWGELGFVPAMTLVTIENGRATTERIPYGTPRRIKLICPVRNYEPDIAYWLDSDDPNAERPDGHPWSRVTHRAERQQTQRITKEQADDVKSLRDLFKLFDPAVSEPVLQKVDTIAGSVDQEQTHPIDARLDRVEIVGCTFFRGQKIALDIASLRSGITDIKGANGEGKSSLLAFCSLYPVVIGKDTPSGKESAFASFFSEPDSRIEKNATVNGQKHRHGITIKGAHTKTPKIEYFLFVDGVPALDRGTWDEMMQKCEELYGRFDDYFLTSFYAQPLQGKTASGLMSANMTEVRDVVQSISGIDRSRENEYALARVREIETKISMSESWLKGATAFAEDIVTINKRIAEEKANLNGMLTAIDDVKKSGADQRVIVDNLREKKSVYEKREESKAQLSVNLKKIADLKICVDTLAENQKKLDSEKARSNRMEDRQKIINENAIRVSQYRNSMTEWTERLNAERDRIRRDNADTESEYQSQLVSYQKEETRLESIIEHAGKPCWKCGALPEKGSEQKVEDARAELLKLVAPAKPTMQELPTTVDGKPDQAVLLTEPVYEKPVIDREAVEQSIITAMAAKEQIIIIEKANIDIEHAVSDYDAQLDGYDPSMLIEAEKKIEELRTQYTEYEKQKSSASASMTSLEQQRSKAKDIAGKVDAEKISIEKNRADLADWNYIAVQLRPAKIPAMELDLITALIDETATRILLSLDNGRYWIQTETQGQGKSGTVDRFDIKVGDQEDGSVRSLIAHSPGEKAFLCDAYTKALIKIRNDRQHRTYSPIIYDEADGPIRPERIPAYYRMQADFYDSETDRVLVVSHSPTAHEFLTNLIEIKSLISA
jgi:hypothetical protein